MSKAKQPPTPPTPPTILQRYLKANYRLVYWPGTGDQKGPHDDDWLNRPYPIEAFREGMRLGVITGIKLKEQCYLHDVDLDWAPGMEVALKLLPSTNFIYGRLSKRISHCFYTTDTPIASIKYLDIDNTTVLIELRGTKKDGTLGYQTMVPPSIWSKDGKVEPLTLVRDGEPGHVVEQVLSEGVRDSAIAMLLVKHLGPRGFTHEARLAFAGMMLRLGLSAEEVQAIGDAVFTGTKNEDARDVQRTVESTARRLADGDRKVAGAGQLRALIGANGSAVVRRIEEWLGKGKDFTKTREGNIIRDSLDNIARAIDLLDVRLSFNAFTDQWLINDRPLEDQQLHDLWFQVDQTFHFRPTLEFFEKVVKQLAWQSSFHPVRDYLDRLTWDGEGRIDTWLIDYGGAEDTPYVRAVSALVLLAAVRRIDEPGCKFDEMLVLESGQGIEKSTALAALCSDRSWFSDDLPLNATGQRLIEATLGKWLIEAADLAGKRKTEIEQLKATMSRQVDRARMAYARLPIERPRQFVFVGTTNSAAYLTDPTGNRRFWPVKVTAMNVRGIMKVRDQFWAEAVVKSRGGASIRLDRALWDAANIEQEKRRATDPWEEIIEAYVTSIEARPDGKVRVLAEKLWTLLGVEIKYRVNFTGQRLSEIMQRLGFVRKRVKDLETKKAVWGYESVNRVKLPFEEDEGQE